MAKKSRNIINIITLISVIVIAFVTTAMVIILSAFNGIDELVTELYSSLDADITLMPAEGKSLPADSLDLTSIEATEGVAWIEPVVEDNVILAFQDKQRIATVKGVTNAYLQRIDFQEHVFQGLGITESHGIEYGILGYGIKQELGLQLNSAQNASITVYAPQKGKKIYKKREQAAKKESLIAGGVFSINLDFDTKYMITSLGFGQDIFNLKNRVSHWEIKVNENDINGVKKRLEDKLPENYRVVTQMEKNAMVYKANKSERLITIFILSFIVLIATFNIFASLTILIIDKAKDRQILESMGASPSSIRSIFFIEGLLLSFAGMLIGLLLGLLICLAQQHIGLVPLQGSIVDYYPIKMDWRDFAMVATIVMGIGLLFSWLPVWMLTRKEER